MRRTWNRWHGLVPWAALLLAVHGAAAQTRVDSTRSDSARKVHARHDSVRVAHRLAEFEVVAERSRAAPPAVTTVDVPAAELRRTASSNSYDLIRRATGIEVHEQGQGPGYASDVVLRGFSSDHSSDVLLSVDGVPINLPVHGHVEGYADWSVLSPAAVSTFRVISGTASPLYGDFALGGVVEVFTAADAQGPSGELSGSSYGDASGWYRTGRRGETGGFLVAGNAQRQEGWRANSSYWLGNTLLRGWRRVNAGRVEGGLSLYGSTWDSPGFVSVAQYNAHDFQQPSDTTDGGRAGRLIAHGRFASKLGSVAVDASGWAQLGRSTVFLTIPEDGVLEQSDEQDQRAAIGGRLQVGQPRGLGDVSAGLDWRADRADYDLSHTDRRALVDPTKGLDGRYAQVGGFARWRTLVFSSLALDLAVRGDALHYRTRNRLASAPWRSADAFVLGPKIGARWVTASGAALLASVSKGFRGAPGVIDDPTLPAIEAWTKELGVRYDGERAHLQLAAFRLDVSNERIQDPITREIFSSGGSVRQGINADVEMNWRGRVVLRADGTVTDARVRDTGASAAQDLVSRTLIPDDPHDQLFLHIEPPQPGDPVPNVARYVGRVGGEWQAGTHIAPRVQLRLSGPYTPIGEPRVRTKPYAVLDVGTAIRAPMLGATIDVDLSNLLDETYPEIRSSGYLNPGAPRTLRVGFRFHDLP